MNISVKDVKNESFYNTLKQIGYNAVDFSFLYADKRDEILLDSYETAVLEKFQYIQNAQLKVSQTHLTYYPAHFKPLESFEEFEEYMFPLLKKEIELTAKLNCKIAVAHLYFEESLENSRRANIRLIEKLLPVLEKNGVILAIENIYGPTCSDVHLSTADDLLFYINHFKSDYIKVCLDTGHAISQGENPAEMVEQLGDSVVALHVHSNVYKKDLHSPLWLSGWVNWREFFDALESVNYSGTFNLEISAPKELSLKSAINYYEMAFDISKSLIERNFESWVTQKDGN